MLDKEFKRKLDTAIAAIVRKTVLDASNGTYVKCACRWCRAVYHVLYKKDCS